MTDQEHHIIDEFTAIHPTLLAWGQHVDSTLCKHILSDPSVKDFVKIFPQVRLKGARSYLFKTLYRKRQYTNPLLEIEDKAATRVVLLKSDEIDKIKDLIMHYTGWNAKVTKTTLQDIEDQPKLFDYQSCHLVVWPNATYSPGSVDGALLTCEIQIRTLLQHAFAEISHDSTYKGPYRADSEILRHLAKSMALMEATDDYFSTIFSLMASQEREYVIFLSELAKLYTAFVPEFNKGDIIFDVNDRLLTLLSLNRVSLEEMEAFIQQNHDDLGRALRPKNGLLFTQPIIMLVAYYLFKHRAWLKENWPLPKHALEGIFRAFNFSFEQY